MAEQPFGGHVGPMMKLTTKLCGPGFAALRPPNAVRQFGVLIAALSCTVPVLGKTPTTNRHSPTYSADARSTNYS